MKTETKENIFQYALEAMEEAVAVLDDRGRTVFANEKYQKLGVEPLDLIDRMDVPDEVSEEIEHRGGRVQLLLRRLPGAHLLVRARPLSADRDKSAAIILDAITGGQDIYEAAARALAAGTGWRWAGISRFTNNGTWAQVLGWWDQGKAGKPFEYPLADAPCQTVYRTESFCFFHEVAKKFPFDADLKVMGAKAYAGQVYTDGQGQALGHVFVIHDGIDVNPDAVREIMNLIVMLIGAELKILELKVRVQLESTAARTDALTSLFNRKAFEEDLQKTRDRFAGGAMTNARLTMIDLDGMKRINDSRGHDEGDRLLQNFARKLSESFPRDRIYRLGGDEFAILFRFAGRDPGQASDVSDRLEEIVRAMRAENFPEAGASAGSADLVETQGDTEELLKTADRRMYARKYGR